MLATLPTVAETQARMGLWALAVIAGVFAVMVVLIRWRIAIGYVLLIAAVMLGVALGVGFSEAHGTGLEWVLAGVWNLLGRMIGIALEVDSLRLLCLVLTITVFGAVMKHVEKLQALTNSLLALLRDRRWAMGWLSSLIGLLPMPGGAMVSAPMVGEVAKDLDISAEDKAAINHWMRHIWEYVDPLYPGLLVASKVFAVSVTGLMLAQAPLTVAAVIAGVVFLLRIVPRHQRKVGDEAGARSIGPVVKAITPVLLVIAAAIVPQGAAIAAKNAPAVVRVLPGGVRWLDRGFVRGATETSMLLALFAVIAALLLANRVGRSDSWALVKKGVTLKMTALVLSICVVQGVLKESQTGDAITAFLKSTGLPAPFVIGTVVFIVGMLLGYTYGFVSICYPVLDSMMRLPDQSLNYPLAAFAFALGFLGVLLSPTHLCLVLSREHFDAGWGGIYRRLLPPSFIVFLTACLMLFWA